MTEYLYQRPNYLARFLVLVGIFFVLMPLLAYVSAIICGVIFNIHVMDILSGEHMSEGGKYLAAAKWYQIGSSIGAFIISSMVFLLSYRERPLDYWRVNRPLQLPLVLKTVLLTFCIIIIGIALMYLNRQIIGNGAFSKWALEQEGNVEGLMEKLMVMNNAGEMLFNIFLAGLIPAIGEEIFFRGTFQRLLNDWTGSKHIAVLVTSVLFALIHMKFTQVLPIFAISLALGYLYAYTGNLWYNILVHFINNTLIVLITYYGKGNKTAEGMLNDTYVPDIFVVATAAAVCGWIFYSIYRNRVTETEAVTEDENSEHFIQ